MHNEDIFLQIALTKNVELSIIGDANKYSITLYSGQYQWKQ